MLSIQILNPQDIEELQNLGTNFSLSPYEVDSYFKTLTDISIPKIIGVDILNPLIKTLTIKAGNKMIGFISFIEEVVFSSHIEKITKTPFKSLTILFLTVREEFRNRGIGKTLINACFEYCKANNVNIVRISTDYGNDASLNLYQKCGFQLVHNWHIYRIYKKNLLPVFNNDDRKTFPVNNNLIEPYHQFLKRRSISWLYDYKIDQNAALNFLVTHLMDQIKAKNTNIQQSNIDNKNIGITLTQDKRKQDYYKLNGSVWTITDLLEDGIRGEMLPIFVQNQLNQIPDFLMAEIWINAFDYETQQIASRTGMEFVYGGFSLHKHFN
ncbi:MAG: GNAT family N-acetyltransferase [Brevinemataceae bacterium]